MKLHDLKPAAGSKKKSIRRGRGDSARKGNFSGRGVKGQNARAGGGVRIGFEGGQTPLLRRLPKLKGFKNPNRIVFKPINLHQIEDKFVDGEVVSIDTLLAKKLIAKNDVAVKILARGTLTKKVTFDGVRLSKTVEALTGKKPSKKEVTAEEA